MFRKLSLSAMLAMATTAAAQAPTAPTTMFTRPVEACIIPAAQYHGVNHNILWAILKVESNFKPATVAKNENGTSDYGMGGMNTIHMPGLAKFGVTPATISDPCISTYVTAWHLRKQMAKHGNNWYGIATYHSATPYYNTRYQIMLKNALIRTGVLEGQLIPVPPLKKNTKSSTGVNKNAKVKNEMSTTIASNSKMNIDID
ncbi:lytic transglycosylase, catalytic [Comamonas testosteroni]|uniref:Lytic transglycosylase, catalytic n=1 Tax=Comamonas testosteroni TaxID=285 RepID=A0A373FAB3_COMTE|nr:lytic transglycosylase domain-containing protein [Comamonas testosteroni]RGE40442.1 lytic transglycosylase, catalytic [Comamonas testosteroni]